jgi:hypothetical protein
MPARHTDGQAFSWLDNFVAIGDNRLVKLVVQPSAIKQLASLPREDRDRLITKAAEFAADPFAPHSWAKPLEGQPDRVRIRQGDWRASRRSLAAALKIALDDVAARLTTGNPG